MSNGGATQYRQFSANSCRGIKIQLFDAGTGVSATDQPESTGAPRLP
jgi:hypothetical protein